MPRDLHPLDWTTSRLPEYEIRLATYRKAFPAGIVTETERMPK